MKKFAEKICEHKTGILLVSLILMVFAFVGMKLTGINYDILVYLPQEIETVQGQDILTDEFGMGAYSVVISENLSGQALLNLEKEFENIDGVNKVISAYDLLGTTIPMDMLPSEITEKLHQDNTDLFFVTFEESTSSTKTLEAISQMKEIAKDKVRIGGMSAMVLDTMNLSDKEIFVYICIAVILCLVVLELSLDSYFVPVLLLGNIGIAILFNLGSNIIFGNISYITKALVAVLQLGVTTDFSIFLYHAYEHQKEKGLKNKEAMIEAIMETFSSVTGSSLTTIAGFLVLCTMSLTLGKDLGLVMAKGVLLGVICVLTVFPSLLLTFDKLITKTKHKPFTIHFEKFNAFVVKHHVIIFILFVLLLVPAYLANNNVGVYYKMDKSLPDTLESIVANTELKEKFNIVSPEIILVDKDMKADDINKMTSEITNISGVDFVLSFAKLKEYGLTENMLPEDMVKVFESDNYQMLFLNSTYDIATDELNNQVKEINTIIKKYDENGILAGEGPLMKDLVLTSDEDFKNVNTSSIVCILIIMMFVLKSLSLPILLILAIEFAIFLNMSVSYFGGVVLPFVAPIVLGTIQLGATIDYAILLTTNYLKERNDGKDKKSAMKESMNYCANSIFVSGMCFFAATFGVGVYSELEMVGSLCTLISRGAIISMLVVLTVLPSILLIFDSIIMKTTILKKRGKSMKKKEKKLAAALLVFSLVLPYNVFALQKEETVYTKLNTDGSVKSTFVTNHLINEDKLETIEDYSNLENIININSNIPYTRNAELLTWNAGGKDIFYQGSLNKQIPVSQNITYTLDGKDISLKDLIGKKGKVEITIKYQNNDKKLVNVNGTNTTLYTPFVVTTATILSNTENTNIKITNGKVINNGTKSIVVGLSSPGLYESLNMDNFKDLDTVKLSFETEKFELASIYSIITPKLLDSDDLSVFDELKGLYKSVDTLQASMNQIEDGSKNVLSGLNTVSSGASLISENLNNVLNKLEQIKNGTADVSDGLKQILAELQKASGSLTSKETQEKVNQIKTLMATNTKTIEKLTVGNQKLKEAYETYGLKDMTYETLAKTNLELYNLKYQYENTYSNNENLITLLTTNNEALSSTLQTMDATTMKINDMLTTLTTALKEASTGADTLKDGTSLLTEGVSVLNSKMKELSACTTTLKDGMTTLDSGIKTFNKEGINTLSSYTNDAKVVTNKVEALVELSENYQIFTMKKDDTAASTKFIQVLDGVKVPKEKENTQTETKKESFWTKFVNLFRR